MAVLTVRPTSKVNDASTGVASPVARRVSSMSAAGAGRARAAELGAEWVLAGRRLEMQGVAEELGVSRATLFRHVGGREELLADALWLVTERTLRAAAHRWEAQRPPGALHCVGTGRTMNALVSQSAALRRLLEDEPALAVRVLTDPLGKVQPGVVAFVEALLRLDMAEHGFRPLVDPGDLAFALVRLGESFLYADVLAARRPDIQTADRLQQALIGSAQVLEHPHRRRSSADRSGRP